MNKAFSLATCSILAGSISSVCCSADKVSGLFDGDLAFTGDEICSADELIESVLNCSRDEDGLFRVKLLRDITLMSDLVLPNGTILDLNGHSIELAGDASVIIGSKNSNDSNDIVYDDTVFVEIVNGCDSFQKLSRCDPHGDFQGYGEVVQGVVRFLQIGDMVIF